MKTKSKLFWLLFIFLLGYGCHNENLLDEKRKFYLLHKDTKGFFLGKLYFEEEMESYLFSQDTFTNHVGSAIMEPLDYRITNFKKKDSLIFMDAEYVWNTEDKVEMKLSYNSKKGILQDLDSKKTFIDSSKIDLIRVKYVSPCQNLTFFDDEEFVQECLYGYVLQEEKRRIKNNDFNWYPRLNCMLYFNDSICENIGGNDKLKEQEKQ